MRATLSMRWCGSDDKGQGDYMTTNVYRLSMQIILVDDTRDYAKLVYSEIARTINKERVQLIKQHPSATFSNRGSIELQVDNATAANANLGALISMVRWSLISVGVDVFIRVVHDVDPITLRVIYQTQIHNYTTDTALLSLGDITW